MGIQTIPHLFCESKMNLAQLPASVALFSVFMCRGNDFFAIGSFVPLTINTESVRDVRCKSVPFKWQMLEMESVISGKSTGRGIISYLYVKTLRQSFC